VRRLTTRPRRVLLIFWNAVEAEARADILRVAGYHVDVHSDAKAGYPALKPWRDNPPDAVVIDQTRLPGQGRALAIQFRQWKDTRRVPIVFAGDDPEQTNAAQVQLPDAHVTTWSRVRGAVKAAIAKPPVEPVVPGTMAGYSGTPLPKKLGIKTGSRVLLLGAPKDFATTLGPLPEGVTLGDRAARNADLILLFVKSRAELARRFDAVAKTLAADGGLWLCWPKKASGVTTDLDGAIIRGTGLDNGLVDYKIAAIDATWSGLKFARRKTGKG